MLHQHSTDSRRRGMTTMEFALILPFMLAMAMATIEAGTMFYSWLTIQKAAQSGARFASTGQGDEQGTRMAQILATTESWLEHLDNGGTEITVRSWPETAATGDGTADDAGGPCQLVEVAVIYNYHPFTPLIGAMLPSVIPLAGSDRKLNEPWRPCE
ncbi:MAG: pilus assembly protein [Pseudodesulfovibrio sp.]|uniref:TadE family protein n=1 Tax=Pseudodesulfovibrio aespoeensis (strain ATCC 700646 / DSM 10631 / Aspo-2) TaxID=643562 RepID=E6VYP7_PSEA9|nr:MULTISPECIES: TadE/TadG family type IV pilus assembly protein [Pseudodesulfovibrio]MBU4243593.1 pilus assembly protein [Pseudomonadota bacterium]ADU63914.1 TadE family protein [Pseudodesulfovibrio aespoeensis Aspo-2]MBU4475419.1 pilus assembly protein [Pseudomonadota bacterium]MBU4517351.1 pilus assembly protein [Pseudomonadota bacterium]MBU4523022.1 pilus assembly protein [Pseudomonadota bacterium]